MENQVDGLKADREFSERTRNSCFEKRGLLALVCILVLINLSLVLALLFTIRKNPTNCQHGTNRSFIHNVDLTSKYFDHNLSDTNDISLESPWPHLRLPRSILPYKYKLKISLDPNNRTFTGSVDINVQIVEETKLIILHAADIFIEREDIFVVGPKNIQLVISDVISGNPHETYVIRMSQDLIKGENYSISFKWFKGFIRDDMRALYRSSYRTEQGIVRYLIASQLEAIETRRVFPCFDEPDMKAVYSVSIIHSRDYVALSNTDLERSEDLGSGDLVMDTFEDTPIMSTYLLAFVVSDFVSRSVTTKSGLKINIWSRPDMINMTSHALNLIPHLYNYFSEYFQCSEVVKKSDHVAAPDFSSGAMENWGLVIYRENILLFDENTTSDYDSWMNSLVIAHEVAHSWFGNMVTMHWWEDLWLNEGFASILMYLPFDDGTHNNSAALNAQLAKSKFIVMTLDSFETSHPISMPIINSHDINNGFDRISYDKGLSLLRMLVGIIGHENFRKGLQAYVHKYKFSNSRASQLWMEMEGFTNLPHGVGEIMDTWMQQKGFPVVEVKHVGGGIYKLDQHRIVANPREYYDDSESVYRYRWIIPFSYVTEDDLESKVIWMSNDSSEIHAKDGKWLLGNVDSMGYYMVNYDVIMWKRIIVQLKNDYSMFSVATRANLINDVFSLARVEKISYDVAFDLSLYLKMEENLVPVMSLVEKFRFLNDMLISSPKYGLLRKLFKSLVKPSLMKCINNPPLEKLQKAFVELLYKEAVHYNMEEVTEVVTKHYDNWKYKKELIHPSYALASFISGVKYGDENDWEAIWKYSQDTTVVSTAEKLMCALGHTKEIWMLKRYLSYSINSSLIKPQFLQSVLTCICENKLGRYVAFDFMVTNWQNIINKFGTDLFTMTDIGTIVFPTIDTQLQYEQLLSTFNKTPPPESVTKEYDNILHQVKSNLEWKNRNQDRIETWLSTHVV